LEPILENTTAHSITAFASTSSGLPHDDRVQRIHRRHTCLVWIVNDIDGLGCHRVVQDSSLRVHLPPKSYAQDKVRVQRSLRDLQSQRPSLLWINMPGPRSRLTYRCSPRVVGRQPDSGKELLTKDGRHLALKANRRIPQWQETSLKGLTDRCCHLRVRLATSVPMEGRTVCALQTAASEPPPIITAMHFAIFLLGTLALLGILTLTFGLPVTQCLHDTTLIRYDSQPEELPESAVSTTLAFPTAAKERQEIKEKATNAEFGVKTLGLHKKKVEIEKHYDDCGEDLSSILFYEPSLIFACVDQPTTTLPTEPVLP
jgi:hypothetical protein